VPELFENFAHAASQLRAKAENDVAALCNEAQPSWIRFSDEAPVSREASLRGLERAEINERFKQVVEKAAETEETAGLVAAIQHDFLAAVTRDVLQRRRPRVGRLIAAANAANRLATCNTAINYINAIITTRTA